jgi:putative hydrolase of the HAD superfamily
VYRTQPDSIKLITFDLGNVLVKVDHMEFCRRLAVLTPLDSEDVFNYVFNGSLEPEYDTGKITSKEFYENIITQFNVDVEFETFARWWNSLFSLMPGMEEVVIKLAKNYPLFLLSNTNALHFDYIVNNYPVLKHFTEFVLSYKVGSRKPEQAIYQYLIRRSGMLPEQILFIDDKMPFVTSAREQGIQAWQFTGCEDLKKQLTQYALW